MPSKKRFWRPAAFQLGVSDIPKAVRVPDWIVFPARDKVHFKKSRRLWMRIAEAFRLLEVGGRKKKQTVTAQDTEVMEQRRAFIQELERRYGTSPTPIPTAPSSGLQPGHGVSYGRPTLDELITEFAPATPGVVVQPPPPPADPSWSNPAPRRFVADTTIPIPPDPFWIRYDAETTQCGTGVQTPNPEPTTDDTSG